MSTKTKLQQRLALKKPQRKTMQVRLDEVWHKKLKELSESENAVMSLILDRICKFFFTNYNN